jgi:hypothetical protein
LWCFFCSKEGLGQPCARPDSVETHAQVAAGKLCLCGHLERIFFPKLLLPVLLMLLPLLRSLHPQVALEWCLLLQEALLWQEWPAAITAASRSTEPGPYTSAAAAVAVAASQQQQQQPLPLALLSPTGPLSPAGAPGQAAAAVDGVTTQAGPAQPEAAGGDASLGPAAGAAAGISSQVLYCGPRVKMGVAAGAPQSVSPDYMGRADYHGNAVNMAARWGWLQRTA